MDLRVLTFDFKSWNLWFSMLEQSSFTAQKIDLYFWNNLFLLLKQLIFSGRRVVFHGWNKLYCLFSFHFDCPHSTLVFGWETSLPVACTLSDIILVMCHEHLNYYAGAFESCDAIVIILNIQSATCNRKAVKIWSRFYSCRAEQHKFCCRHGIDWFWCMICSRPRSSDMYIWNHSIQTVWKSFTQNQTSP